MAGAAAQARTRRRAHGPGRPRLTSSVRGTVFRSAGDDRYAHPLGPAQTIRTGCLPCRMLAGAGALLLPGL